MEVPPRINGGRAGVYGEGLPFREPCLLPADQEVEEVKTGAVRTKPERTVFSLSEYGIDLSVYGRKNA